MEGLEEKIREFLSVSSGYGGGNGSGAGVGTAVAAAGWGKARAAGSASSTLDSEVSSAAADDLDGRGAGLASGCGDANGTGTGGGRPSVVLGSTPYSVAGIKEWQGQTLHYVEDYAVIIDFVHAGGRYAKGRVLRQDFTTERCYIVKYAGRHFGVGSTYPEAYVNARNNMLNRGRRYIRNNTVINL